MLKWFLVAIAVCASSAASAQPAPSSTQTRTQPDTEAIAAARELLAATDFLSQMNQAAHLTAQATFGSLLQQIEARNGFDFPEELRTELRQIMLEEVDVRLAAMRETVLDDAAEIYGRYFSAEEIRELQRLQTHPVMRRLQQIAPQLTAELAQLGLAGAVERAPELERRISAAVEAWLARQEGGTSPQT
jgi:hypothetical protein